MPTSDRAIWLPSINPAFTAVKAHTATVNSHHSPLTLATAAIAQIAIDIAMEEIFRLESKTPLVRPVRPFTWYSFRNRTRSNSWPSRPTTDAIWATESHVAKLPNASGNIACAASENIANARPPLPTFRKMVPATPRVTSRCSN